MSDIEKHLRWLRDVSGRTNLEAAAAIEALVKENVRLEDSLEGWADKAAKAEAQVERLKGVLARMREGLELIANGATGYLDRDSELAAIARAALEP